MDDSNTHKIILDLCAGSGAWSKPYRDAGYDVRLITLPDNDVMTYTPPTGVYGILAAPPCTEFSKAKSTKPRDFEKGMETIVACLNIIWTVQKGAKLAFWALENPTGLLRRFLGNPPYSFKQWWFGNDRTKDTDLWGKFQIPARTVKVAPLWLQSTKGYLSKEGKPLANRNAKWYSNINAADRAITPSGFAKAFFKANQ